MNCQAAHSNRICPVINLTLFLSTDHEMAQRNGDHLMEIVRVIPERHTTWYSVRLLLSEEKNHISSWKCAFTYTVQLIFHMVGKLFITLETSLLWMEGLLILLCRIIKMALIQRQCLVRFFFLYKILMKLKLAKMSVLWRWALPTNSACSTIDRTHQTCGGTSANESKRKCILLKWNIFIGLINQTAVWKVLFFSLISFKDPFQS